MSEDNENNIEKAPFSNFSPAGNELLGPFDFSEASIMNENASLTSYDSSLVSKQQNVIEKYPSQLELGGMHPFEILGMFGHNEELLFFEKSVGIHEGIEG